MNEWNNGEGTSDYTPMNQINAFSLVAGDRHDLRVTRGLAWRVAALECTHPWIFDVDMTYPQDGIGFYSGFVLRVGTWSLGVRQPNCRFTRSRE
jgi:hypothetical protein